jgi:hypothetical protein
MPRFEDEMPMADGNTNDLPDLEWRHEQATDPKPPAADEDEFVDDEMSMSDGNNHKPLDLNAGYEQTSMPNNNKNRLERERAEQARTRTGNTAAPKAT